MSTLISFHARRRANDCMHIADKLSPVLAEHPLNVRGAVLANLLAALLVELDEADREKVFAYTIGLIRELMPLCAEELGYAESKFAVCDLFTPSSHPLPNFLRLSACVFCCRAVVHVGDFPEHVTVVCIPCWQKRGGK